MKRLYRTAKAFDFEYQPPWFLLLVVSPHEDELMTPTGPQQARPPGASQWTISPAQAPGWGPGVPGGGLEMPGRPWGRPRTRWRDYISWLAWEHLGVPLEELVEVAGESLDLPAQNPDPVTPQISVRK